MDFSAPATFNAIDRAQVVGKPTDRIDGPLKTTGTAPYAYERHDVAENPAYGYLIGSAIPKGRVKSFDLEAAKASPGVLEIITFENAGDSGAKLDNNAVTSLLAAPTISHYHQTIACVVAGTFEQARAAANKIKVEYERAEGSFDLESMIDPDESPDPSDRSTRSVGNFEEAFGKADVTIDQTYTVADESHQMMEPHATIAAWDGDKLNTWTSNQMIGWAVGSLAQSFGLQRDKLHVSSPYIGGGFGSKLRMRSDLLMASIASKMVGRPVKIALQRPLIMNNTGHRAKTVQRIRIGTTADGKIQAIAHECWSGGIDGRRGENGASQTSLIYAGENRLIRSKTLSLDLPDADAMRAPGEAPGLMALEVAIDEMAEAVGMDPVEFRIQNDTKVNPSNPEQEFSQQHLVECLKLGAERFGWSERQAKPATVRRGRRLIGMGVAAGIRNNILTRSSARVTLDKAGIVTVETDMTDIGTGSYTIVAQTAAETMGLPLSRVKVKLGESSFPASCGSGGQWGAANSTAGVYAACMKLRETIATKLGLDAKSADFTGGSVSDGDKSMPLARAATDGNVSAEDTFDPGNFGRVKQQSTFAGHFAEVSVDVATGEIRIQRMLAACCAGRIINPKSARSQVIGAMVMGAGAALMEHAAVDKEKGFFVNHDLAGYEVPCHADIPHQDVIFLDETDPYSTPIKAKGVGELGICGVGAAIANAVYNACGIRVRNYPITLDKLLDQLPPLD